MQEKWRQHGYEQQQVKEPAEARVVADESRAEAVAVQRCCSLTPKEVPVGRRTFADPLELRQPSAVQWVRPEHAHRMHLNQLLEILA